MVSDELRSLWRYPAEQALCFLARCDDQFLRFLIILRTVPFFQNTPQG